MKFEEAYSSYDAQTHTLEDIRAIASDNRQLFVEKYQKSLFCPECRKAQLAYHNTSTPHFQAYPEARHEPGCILTQEEMSPVAANTFITANSNGPIIQRQMQSLLNRLYGEKAQAKGSTPKSALPTKEQSAVVRPGTTTKKRMGRKLLNGSMDKEDYFCAKYFYGRVHVMWEETKARHKILIYRRDRPKLLCRLIVTPLVYERIKVDWKAPHEYDCVIAIAGEANPVDSRGYVFQWKEDFEPLDIGTIKKYFQMTLFHSDCLLIMKE